MGHFSEMMIQEAEQRLRLGGIDGRKVCSQCFGDPNLSALIEANSNAGRCDYCGDESDHVQATDLTTVLEYMLPQIDLEFDRADQALPVDPDTKERMFSEDEMDTRTMLELEIELELPRDTDCELIEDITDAMPEQDWCYRDPLIDMPSVRIGASWDAFKTVIKHRRRFFFLAYQDEQLDDDVSWGAAAYSIPELLEHIGNFTVDHELITPLPEGSRWVRCQGMKPEEKDFGPRRMGPPPYDKSEMPNRMSPSGVPMFYGASDIETALAEIADGPGRFAAGTFATKREILVLDVRAIPAVPSLFDEHKAKDRPIAQFMASFIEDFRAPIDRKKRPHIDYLPTQVITEYFRTMVRTPDKRPVEGVLYSSTKNGRDAIVLFAENEDVMDSREEDFSDRAPWLEMVGYTEIEHAPKDAQKPEVETARP